MKSNWKECTLGSLTSYMAKGIAPKYTEDETDHTISVLNQKCNRDFRISYNAARLNDCQKKKVPADKILQEFDVLINSTGMGTAGRVAQVISLPCKTTVDGHMIILRADKDAIDPLYFGYAVKNKFVQIESLAEGSTGQTEINRQRLNDEIIIRYPESKDLQRFIARTLRQIDDKIALNQKINENLEQQAQAIYQKMFVEDRDPQWPDGLLSDLISVKYGKDHKKLADGNIPTYGSGGLMRYVEKPLYEKESVLIPRKGTLNNVMYVNEPFWTVDTMFYTEMLRPNIAKFIYHFVSSKDLVAMNTGSAVPSMTTKILNAMELKIPPEDVLEKFEKIVAPLYSAMQRNQKENEKLASLRDALLPQLMSGELDVSEVEM